MPSPYSDGFIDRLRDRIQLLRGDSRAGITLLVVVAVVAGFLWYRAGIGSSQPAPPAGRASSSPTSSEPASTAGSVPGSASGATPTTSRRGDPAGVVVHVAGAVKTPGVVELAAGARVIDALEAAGGGLPEADLDRLNLAAKLIDGQRVYVTRVGEVVPPINAEAAPTADGVPAGAPIPLNTATGAQLETLPGIGPALAAAIIAERDRRGGFRSVNELRDVDGIGDKRFAQLKDLVTV